MAESILGKFEPALTADIPGIRLQSVFFLKVIWVGCPDSLSTVYIGTRSC